MSYIIDSTSPFISIKLTETGRQQLALGQLNFSYWAVGDSEINYNREEIVDDNQTDVRLSGSSKVLRPFDRQPNIKSFIIPSSSNTQYQPINGSNMSVVKAIVNNEALERGFFIDYTTAFTTSLDISLTPYQETIPNTRISGGTNLSFTSTTQFNVGDLILLKVDNSLAPINTNDTTVPIPNLWFKVQNITGGTVQVDRTVPNYSGVAGSSIAIIYKGGEIYDTIATGTTTAYWDSGTLSFNSNVDITCHDVPVWNMNNVWCEDLAGMTGSTGTTVYEDYTKFGSYRYLGTKNPYLEYLCESLSGTNASVNCTPGTSYLDEVSKSISIVHYTNNSISNLYGEFLFVDATNNKIVKVHLPDLMYHRSGFSTQSGTSMGMTFVASGATQTIGTSDIQYIDLIEEPSMISTANTTPLVVGKVLPQLKMIVFHDDEIVAALSYKSNRNWTLPFLSANLASPSGGTSTGVLLPSQTAYLTYSLETNGNDLLSNSLPCQTYVKLTNNTSSAKDITFRINETDLLPYMRKIESIGYDGLGFFARKFKLMYQIVSDSLVRPDPSQWKAYDFTSPAITVNAGETIAPNLLENQNPLITGFILDILKDSAASTFVLYPLLNLPPNTQPSYLQFGDERFFYGNIETFIGATIFKTIFDIRLNSSYFNSTTNPTRSTDPSTNPPNIKVTEVGIYDVSQNLVCIGKLSTPVELDAGNTIMIELSLDF